jgi:hypothetical protein
MATVIIDRQLPDKKMHTTTPAVALKRLLASSSARLPSAPWTEGYGPSRHQSSVDKFRFKEQKITRSMVRPKVRWLFELTE